MHLSCSKSVTATGVELTLKINDKKEKRTAIAIDELSMFIATIANFINKYLKFGLF